MKYFDLFNMPVSFLPDEAVIRQQYFALSKKYHPDFAATLPIQEQVQTLEHATAVNKAYQTLSNFDKRMQYILMETGAIEEEGKFNLPPAFLMEMMDLSEEAMALKFESTPEKKESLFAKIKTYDNQLLNAVMPILQAWTVDQSTDEQIAAIREFYYKRKYLLRIKAQMQ